MLKFAELGTAHRNEPCEEFPGTWLSYVNGGSERQFPNFEEASVDARTRQEEDPDPDTETSVCWKCSDNDPRIGETWFTPFYRHGRYNVFGRYVTT